MNITLNVDSKTFTQKPKGQAIVGGIRNRLCKKSSIVTITPEELEEVIQRGQSFSPAEMSGLDADGWESQQVIIADIDNEYTVRGEDGKPIKGPDGKTVKKPVEYVITPDRLRLALGPYKITPYFTYTTFSNSEDLPKLRPVFVLDKKITDREKATDLTARITALFNRFSPGCCDTTMIDPARLLFGSKPGSVIFDDRVVTTIDQIEALPPVEDTKSSEANTGRSGSTHTMQTTDEQRKSVEFVEAWAGEHGVTILHRKKRRGNIVLCVMCPWKDEHSMDSGSSEAAIVIKPGGTIGFKCQHASHIDKTWRDFRGFYEPEYLEREEFTTLEPGDYTDVGQAGVLVREYGEIMAFSKATGFLIYDGSVWREDETQARKLSQVLTTWQLEEARERIRAARKKLDEAIEADPQDPEAVTAANLALKSEEKFRSYVLSRRSSTRISSTLTEAAPQVAVKVEQLDADGYLLNTPAGTVDLRTGEIKPHSPKDYCTKITTVSPGNDGREEFEAFLSQLSCEDPDFIRYLQEITGLACIGVVKVEQLITAYGSGGNGKSTFFNVLFKVLGDYSGMLSAETLTVQSRKNKSPEYAELRGKRLVIAAELEEGLRLDTAVVKKLCSTDPVYAERKYKDPFYFFPSHHVVLFTNHLPKVGTNDDGTWSRLQVLPFQAKFRGQAGEIKDYAEELYQKCGGYVLRWMIEGAGIVIRNMFMIRQPDCVLEAIGRYKDENDWLSKFLDEYCDQGGNYSTESGRLYRIYRTWCDDVGEFKRSAADFKKAMEARGFRYHKSKTGNYCYGLALKGPFQTDKNPAIHGHSCGVGDGG